MEVDQVRLWGHENTWGFKTIYFFVICISVSGAV